jgi:hypothetical protein
MFALPGLQSPILKTSLELLVHAFEHYSGGTPRDYRFCVLHLAHAAELAVKAALVERNQSIYLGSAKTLDVHAAINKLKTERHLPGNEDLAYRSRLDLLIDERNAIQHRYGTVDEVTMRYLLEGAFYFLYDLMYTEFNLDLRNYIQVNLNDRIRRALTFLTNNFDDSIARITQLADENPPIAVLELELLINDQLFEKNILDEKDFLFMPLAAIQKFTEEMAISHSIEYNYTELASQLSELHRLVMREDHAVTPDEIKKLLPLIELFALRDSNPDAFKQACRKAQRKIVARFPGGHLIVSDAEIGEVETKEEK